MDKGVQFLRPCLLIILTVALFSVISCGKEERQPAKSSGPAVNPYSSESVFEEVNKKLKENPNDVDVLYHLGDLYERNAQYKEAIDAYTKVLKIKPDMGFAYFKIGTAHDRLNQPAEAVEAFKKSLKYMPGYPVAYNNLGVAYGKLGKLNEEIEALKKAIKLRPSYSSARFNLGITYLKTKNRKAAMKEYEALKDFDEGAAESLMREIKNAS